MGSAKNELWQRATIPINATIREAIDNLDKVSVKIIMIIDPDGGLHGTISDGDIRRGLLKGLDLNSPIASVVHRNSLVVSPDISREIIVQLMVTNKIQQIPVVDGQHRVVGLHLWDEVTTPIIRPNVMVIMCGGLGTRLLPYTEKCPKPMLPIVGRPMLEHIIERAKLEGFSNFILAINYLGHIIEDYFGNGDNFGVRIEYLREPSPLGTAGALELMNPLPTGPFLVTNGDVITDIHYGDLLDFHIRHNAAATMAVRLHEWQHPFGVVQTKGIEIVGFEEKPVYRSHINAGIYALDPSVISHLSEDSHCDMPLLFERIKLHGKTTIAYPMYEPWLDVGRPDDLFHANNQALK